MRNQQITTFYNALSLKEINIDPANTTYCSVDGVLYNADIDTLLIYPAGKDGKSYTVEFPMKAIGSSAFSHAVNLQTVAIPEGVTTICDIAFSNCTSLQKVSFPESITKIEVSAFYHCEKLESIVLPPNITEIPMALFFQCTSLRSVTIPAGVTLIDTTPFIACPNLKEITCLATTPPTLDASAFYLMTQGDITLYVPEEAVETYKATPTWKDFNVQPVTKIEHFRIGDLYYNLDLQDKTAQVTWQFYLSYDNYESLTAANIPAAVSYEGQELNVTEIGVAAFAGCRTGITSVSIPESVTCINDSAFCHCEVLAEVNIPNSVERIGRDAFIFCLDLNGVSFGSGLKTIEFGAFTACQSLTTVAIPDNVERIGDTAFGSCFALKTATIGSGAASIGDHIFNSCSSLEEITVSPENPAYCSEDGVFFNKDKTILIKYPDGKAADYVVPGSVTKIESNAFTHSINLTSVTLPDGLITIGNTAFSFCNCLTEVVIPNSVTSIGDAAFTSCQGLTKVTIGCGVTNIGSIAFLLCNAITTIYNHAVTPQEVDVMTFGGVNADVCKLYVPAESVELYKAAPVWKNFDIKPISGTGITPMANGQCSMFDDAWYTLDGHRLDGKPAQRGIYIHGGRKVVMK